MAPQQGSLRLTRRDASCHVHRQGDEVRGLERTVWHTPASGAAQSIMSPSAEYEPVPTDTQPDPSQPPLKARSRFVIVRRLLLFSLTILLVSFAAFKSSQWSAEKSLLQQQPSDSHQSEDIATDTPVSTPSNNTDMSGDGKYSVG